MPPLRLDPTSASSPLTGLEPKPKAQRRRTLTTIEAPKRWVLGVSRPTSNGPSPLLALRGGELLKKRDLVGLFERLDALAGPGVQLETAGWVDGHPIRWVRLAPLEAPPKLRVLITAGVHGKEAAGPAAALQLLESLQADPLLRRDIEWTVVPVICPTGYLAGTRRNGKGINLNRVCTKSPNAPAEIKIARQILDDGHYDLSIDLHASKSAGDRGFFAIHNGGEDLLALAMPAFLARHEVLDRSTELYERTSPGIFRSKNEGTFKDYLRQRGTERSYTVEAPALAPYEKQVEGLADFVRCVVAAASMDPPIPPRATPFIEVLPPG